MFEVFETDDCNWRGIGVIKNSGLRIKEKYRTFDAEQKFKLEGISVAETTNCISGEILQGIKKPNQCSEFGKKCTPENPIGAPMVSHEGACSAYYRYGQFVKQMS